MDSISTILNYEHRDMYESYYSLLDGSYSDFSFSVIQSWLSFNEPVYFKQISDTLLLISYTDVLDTSKGHTKYIGLVGKPTEQDLRTLENIFRASTGSVFAIPDCILKEIDTSYFTVSSDPGNKDYIYSVEEYLTLELPAYRRIRRQLRLFESKYSELPKLRELEKDDTTVQYLLNTHHSWDNTYIFNNDPQRLEGLVLSKILYTGEKLATRIFGFFVEEHLEAFVIVTVSSHQKMTFANIHHFRNSYAHEHTSDIAFHLLAQYFSTENITYMNFERDSNIDGLRQHKQLLKPVMRLQMHQCYKTDQ